MSTADLDARYGRTPRRTLRAKVFAWLAASATALTVGVWVIWVGVLDPSAALDTRDVGFTILSEDTVQLRWQLSAQPGEEVSCAVKAVSANGAVVGWRIIKLEASPETTRVLQANIRTSESATGALLHNCWLG